MLKTNVTARIYRLTLLSPTGQTAMCSVYAESETAAQMKASVPEGWKITEVTAL